MPGPRLTMQPESNPPQPSIRAMTHADIAEGMRLCRACNWNQLEDDWRLFLELEGAGCRIAEQDGAIAGTAAYLAYGRDFSWIAMMLVDPRVRRGGIGSALLASALDCLRDQDTVRLDATPAGEPLYRRFGFVGEYPLARSALTVDGATFTPTGGTARPMQAAELPEILARDRAVFGADRGALLASFYRRAPDLAWVAGDGYCFGRPGYRYSQLGPVIAPDPETARQLVSYCLVAQHGKRFAMDVPRHSPDWIAWLESAGFAIERPFLRMCRGRLPDAGAPERQFAIGGPEFG